jgi:recombination protein RecA
LRKDLESLVKKFNGQFGFNALRPASDLEDALYRISTGSVSLDIALGGGIPAGRLVTIAGAYSACKSAIAYHIIKSAQKMRKKKVLWEKYSTKDAPVYRWVICDPSDKEGVPLTCALIQSESHSYTNDWAERVGVDVENLIFVSPCGMEEATEVAVQLQVAGIDVIVFDSYAALIPIKELNKEMQETMQMGVKQKLFGEYHGKFQSFNNKADREGSLPTTVIAINQLREKIGAYGNPEYITGGRSVGFTEAVEIRLRKGDSVELGKGNNKHIIGQSIKFKVEKNKTYKPFQTGEFDFYFDGGGLVPAANIDNAKELIIEAIMYGIIETKGSWFFYKGHQLAQGKEKTIELIRADTKLFDEVKAKTMELAFSEEKEREDVFGEDGQQADIIVEEADLEIIIDPKPVVAKKGRKK